MEKPLSIMDYYQHDMFSHMEKDSRRISQYNLLHKESPLDGKAGDRLSVSIFHWLSVNVLQQLKSRKRRWLRWWSGYPGIGRFPFAIPRSS